MASPATTQVRMTALDGLMSINSFFTFAIFIGVSSTTTRQSSLEGTKCDAGSAFAKRLFVFEFLSFSCFLTSSLVAWGLKFALLFPYIKLGKQASSASRSYAPRDMYEIRARAELSEINFSILQYGMIISGVGSWFGCLFLVISMFHYIQIRLGIWSCGTADIYISVCSLVLPLVLGLGMYSFVFVRASRQEPGELTHFERGGHGALS